MKIKFGTENCGKIVVSKEQEIDNFNSFTESLTKKGIEFDVLTSEQSSKI